MSDEGEKTCPLCAEEMDLTDQQLKPCKCGYEICVWCWHHIMDMAEKDETEGRCPACRTPYNKEKIVGTAASCERLVSEMNVEKKKSHKVKSKTSEGRKHLASVRVIQRNLVYVVGLPLNFADEDLLQRREYFGQYGKVLKVSISRTASGAIQHSANSTCSVYITYTKEEEAVRCIQSVHGFVLDGRSLRACFGTTKYCHAWLRNMPCGNPECLYLHEIGSQEDSFTKDEIISAYSRVQRITGSSNSALRRTGNVLPPPVDEYCNNVSPAKSITKAAVNTNNSAGSARVSPPNSSSGRSAALPAGASWGTRASNNQISVGSMQSSNGPPGQKSDVCNGPVSTSTVTESPSQISSLQSDTGKMLLPNKESFISQNTRKSETGGSVKKESGPDQRTKISESSFTSVHSATLPLNRQQNGSSSTNMPTNSTDDVDSSITASGLATNRETTDGSVDNISSDILAMGIYDKQNLENGNAKCVIREPVASHTSVPAVDNSEPGLADVQSDSRLEMPTQVTQEDLHETENHMMCFAKQKRKDPERVSITKPEFCYTSSRPKHSNMYSSLCVDAEADTEGSICTDLDRTFVGINSSLIVKPTFPSGHSGTQVKGQEVKDIESSNHSKERLLLGGYGGEPAKGVPDVGESSIISNILSMDFDAWDDTLTSPHNLAKLIRETDTTKGFLGVPGSLKIHSSNQSRFSFAREDEPLNQASNLGQSMGYIEKGFLQHSLGNDISNRSGIQVERLANHSGFPVVNVPESNISAGGFSDMLSNRLSVSRSQISAPPGFSAPGRAPPPGFNSHERTDQNLDMVAGNHMLDVNSLLRNHYQTASSANNTISNGDIEFMDPAILAVGKGILPGVINNPGVDLQPSYSSQLNSYEEARFRSLLQRSLPHQNQRFTDIADGYAPFGDAYGIPSRFLEQKLANNLSPISQFSFPQSRNGLSSHGQLDGWNDMQSGSSLGMADMLRTDRFGFNKFYSGYEESKVRTPSSGNLYSGTYGI